MSRMYIYCVIMIESQIMFWIKLVNSKQNLSERLVTSERGYTMFITPYQILHTKKLVQGSAFSSSENESLLMTERDLHKASNGITLLEVIFFPSAMSTAS